MNFRPPFWRRVYYKYIIRLIAIPSECINISLKRLNCHILPLFLTEQKEFGCQRNGKAISEKSYSTLKLESQCRGFASLNVSVEGRMPLSVKSPVSERGVSRTNKTAPTSTDPGDGWTLVTSKSQRLKSIPDWPSLPGPSIVEDNSTLQGSNSTAENDFSANRFELQELKYEQKSRRHFRRGSALASSGSARNADYVVRQSPSPSRHLESAGLHSFLNREESPRQDIFSTDQELSSHPDVKCTDFTEYGRTPARFSDPFWNSSAELRAVDFRKAPKSQWDSLEQISHLQIHGVLTTKVKSDPPINNCISPQAESIVHSWSPPQGVSTLCAHFLEDNRKGQPYRSPNSCVKCKKQSKLFYGIWRSDTREWQVMRPYPKDVNPNVPFQLCRHFSNHGKCQKNPCTFAHGKKELMFWTSKRQSGK